MLANLGPNEDDLPSIQAGNGSPPRNDDDDEIQDKSNRKAVSIQNDEDSLEAALGLGELAGLTVNDESDPLSYDVTTKEDYRCVHHHLPI